MKMGHIEITFTGCVLFEVLSDKRIHIVAGYSDHPLFPSIATANNMWRKEIAAPFGSAELTNKVEALKNELIENLPQAIRTYAAKVKQIIPV
jgi:hypothetical protein